MNINQWITLSISLILGAISPGPSIVLVIKNTLSGSQKQGIYTAIGHGFGFGLYAFISSIALSTIITYQSSIELYMRILGALLLLWISCTFIGSKNFNLKEHLDHESINIRLAKCFKQGFLIAFLNPKILAWMLAIYIPFINPSYPPMQLIYMGILAIIIDSSWYIGIAIILSKTTRLSYIKDNVSNINKIIGIILAIYAITLINDIVQY